MGGSVSVEIGNGANVIDKIPKETRAELAGFLEEFLEERVFEYAPSDVEVQVFRAHGLPTMDGASKSDPYVQVSLKRDRDTMVHTKTIKNNEYPNWNGERLQLGPVEGLDSLIVEVYDSDTYRGVPDKRFDDLIGEIEVELDNVNGSFGFPVTHDILSPEGARCGTLTFAYTRLLDLPSNENGEKQILEYISELLSKLPEKSLANGKPVSKDTGAVLQAFQEIIVKRVAVGASLSEVLGKKNGETIFHRLLAAQEAGTLTQLVTELSELPAREPVVVQQQVQQGELAEPIQQEAVEQKLESKEEQPIIHGDVTNDSQGPVIRKEIREMSREEQQRFVNAIMKTMESDTPGGSEWLRIAGYHGWPSNDGEGFCTHRAESFPGWHRAYLLELERALQAADQALGNDGRIALPYWDFSKYSLNGEVMPKIIRENFGETFKFPENFFPTDAVENSAVKKFKKVQFSRINSEEKMQRKMGRLDLRGQSIRCLDTVANSEHWQHASTENKAHDSVEAPHNSAHNTCGYPLTSLKFAAFHPMFWLLHCQTDRLYEKYLQMEGSEECRRESEQHQKILEDQGKSNLYTKPMEPFPCPFTYMREESDRDTWAMEHAFMECGSDLGYIYDSLPSKPHQMMQEMPKYALFKNVDVAKKLRDEDGITKSFDAHIFACPKGTDDVERVRVEVSELVEEQKQELESHENYAGSCSLFGGKGPKCENCKENAVINAYVNLNDIMAKLGVASRHDLEIFAVLEDEFGEYVLLENVQQRFGSNVEIPRPILTGPLFEKSCPDLSQETAAEGNFGAQSALVQAFLARRGYYNGKVDGDLGPVTAEAIKRFQEFSGLKPDGLIGPITKATMKHTRYDTKHDEEDTGAAPKRFSKGQTIKYWIGPEPGYLAREEVVQEIEAAFNEWASIELFKFEQVTEKSSADITLRWANHTDDNDMIFDGPGGEIACANENGITFDVMERWTCAESAKARKRRSFRLRPVVLHEIGHVLGLVHCADPRRVMAPYYVKSRLQLTQADKEALSQLYQE